MRSVPSRATSEKLPGDDIDRLVVKTNEESLAILAEQQSLDFDTPETG